VDRRRLSHVDENGSARMVDVSAKMATHRRAVAEATVRMRPETAAMIVDGRVPKGDVLAVARVAGIMAAKRTSTLIPLCHPIAITQASVDFEAAAGEIRIEAAVETDDVTGVEMEALTAASVAALTLYDMCKAVDRGITVDGLRLLQKEGGKTGLWTRGDDS
jgi:cyclic pyranopterin monophosphate synthase